MESSENEMCGSRSAVISNLNGHSEIWHVYRIKITQEMKIKHQRQISDLQSRIDEIKAQLQAMRPSESSDDEFTLSRSISAPRTFGSP